MDFSDHKTVQKSFAWIKKHLDPSRSYIIFENDLNKQTLSILSDSHIAYQYLKKANYAWKKVGDPGCSKEYLVIQTDLGNEDETLGKVVGYGFSKDIVYYLYKAEKKME
jgi:hypothetical protein